MTTLQQINFIRLRKKIDNELGMIQGVPATVELKHAVDEYFAFLKNNGAISSYSTHFKVDPITFNTVIHYFYEVDNQVQARGILGVTQYGGCETADDYDLAEDAIPDFMDLFKDFK